MAMAEQPHYIDSWKGFEQYLGYPNLTMNELNARLEKLASPSIQVDDYPVGEIKLIAEADLHYELLRQKGFVLSDVKYGERTVLNHSAEMVGDEIVSTTRSHVVEVDPLQKANGIFQAIVQLRMDHPDYSMVIPLIEERVVPNSPREESLGRKNLVRFMYQLAVDQGYETE